MSSVFILVGNVFVAIGCLWLVRRRFTPQQLKANNDVAGFYSALLGTLYAVILAFMLSRVWGDFAEAESNVAREANALVDIDRLAEGVSPSEGLRIQALTHSYTLVTVEQEWPAMQRQEESLEAQQVNDRLWRALVHLQPHTAAETVVVDHLLSKLTDLSEYQRMRHLQSVTHLPRLLWAVMLVGGWITIGFSCLFGVENVRLHLVKTLTLTLMISLVLIAIGELNDPFQGWLYVQPDGFVFATKTFTRLQPQDRPGGAR